MAAFMKHDRRSFDGLFIMLGFLAVFCPMYREMETGRSVSGPAAATMAFGFLLMATCVGIRTLRASRDPTYRTFEALFVLFCHGWLVAVALLMVVLLSRWLAL